MKIQAIQTALLASVFLLQGCGGSSNNNDDDPTGLIGVFLDSEVAGVQYRTETKSGITNADGEYEYEAGETVTFSIGDLDFPPVAAAGTVTPLDIVGTDDPTDTTVVNMIRLLQTLDEDGDPSNGITITEAARAAGTSVDFALDADEFEDAVSSLVESSTGQTELVSSESAVAHFQGTLSDSGVTFESIQGSWQLAEGEVILHFLPDGRYLAVQWQEENGMEGYEYGTYVARDGNVTFTTVENTDGDALTCEEPRGTNCTGEDGTTQGVWAYTLSEGKLNAIPAGSEATIVFDPIVPNTASLDGLWESLTAKELVYFFGGDSYIFVDYGNTADSGDAIFIIGEYDLETVDGNTEIITYASRTYSNEGLLCEQLDGEEACDTSRLGYSVINQQLVLSNADEGGRGYFNPLLSDDGAPANTGKLVAQKQFANDEIARTVYGVDTQDDYRTYINNYGAYEGTDASASSVSIKFNIDEDSGTVRGVDGNNNVQARLLAVYAYPGNESRDLDLSLNARVQLRDYGSSVEARYHVSTCFDENCDDELIIEEQVDFAGSFTGDHTMKIDWKSDTSELAFLVDGAEIGRIAMADYASDSRVIAAGGYSFSPSHYTGTRISVDVYDVQTEGSSGYIAMYVDKVTTNDEVYDDFTAGLIDDSKWYYRAEER